MPVVPSVTPLTKPRKHELRVKIKSLAEEAKIIRKEIKKTPEPWTRVIMYNHKIGYVRLEARAAQLVQAFLRGHTRAEVEDPNKWIQAPRALFGRCLRNLDTFGVEDLEIRNGVVYPVNHKEEKIVQECAFRAWFEGRA